MKVKEIAKKLRVTNAIIRIKIVTTNNLIFISKEEFKSLKPENIMNMKINRFDIIDNVFTIYAESNNK